MKAIRYILFIFTLNCFIAFNASAGKGVVPSIYAAALDSVPKKDKIIPENNSANKNKNGQIKEVPAARRMAKPQALGMKPKVKPVKIVKPKIVTKGIGR